GWPVGPGGREPAAVAMFALDNLDQVQKSYLDKVQQEAAKADKTLAAQITGLGKDGAGVDVADAAKNLDEYQGQMQAYGLLALGAIAVAALTLACLFLVAALVGMARGSVTARRRLATAFAAGIVVPLCLPVSGWIKSDKIEPRLPEGFAANPKPLGLEIAKDLSEPNSFKVEKRGPLIAVIDRANPPRERPP